MKEAPRKILLNRLNQSLGETYSPKMLQSQGVTEEEARLDELRGWAQTHLSLYKQEKDEEGQALYQPITELLEKATSIQEIKNLLK